MTMKLVASIIEDFKKVMIKIDGFDQHPDKCCQHEIMQDTSYNLTSSF